MQTARSRRLFVRGRLINPRTVVLAQHCSVDVPDEGFGPGQGNHMGFSFNPTDSFTGFDVWRRGGNPTGPINNPITGVWKSLPDQSFFNVLQVKSVFNVTEFFPGGDILMASFDTPVIGVPTYGMLFSSAYFMGSILRRARLPDDASLETAPSAISSASISSAAPART